MSSALNENEIKVLMSVVDSIRDCTGNEFGFTEDVKVEGLTKNQIKGYLSQLQQKKMIHIFDDSFHQVMLTAIGEKEMNMEGQFNLAIS